MAMITPFERVGFALVGLGDISQTAILPAFRRSKKAKLIDLVSGDNEKAERLAKQFGVNSHHTYRDYAGVLNNPQVEAIFIATPPGVREQFTVRAAKAGKHVLCEKPLAATAKQCQHMVSACRSNHVLLMTAYRKYFDPATLALKDLISKGGLGRIDVVHTLFTEFRSPNGQTPAWLLSRKLGGGPLRDDGVYCVNTCRWLIGEDPVEATASAWTFDRKRFKEVEEGIVFCLTFPSGVRLQGTASFGAALSSFVHVHGQKGWAALAPAFAFEEERRFFGKTSAQWFQRIFKRSDEFFLEIDEFADCIQSEREPEPSGEQGMRDLVIIEAIYSAAREQRAVRIKIP